jgi:hypothetical protein
MRPAPPPRPVLPPLLTEAASTATNDDFGEALRSGDQWAGTIILHQTNREPQ